MNSLCDPRTARTPKLVGLAAFCVLFLLVASPSEADSPARPEVTLKKRPIKMKGPTFVKVVTRNSTPISLTHVHVCLKAPARVIAGSGCKAGQKVDAEGALTSTFKIRTRKSARSGRRYRIVVRVIAPGIPPVQEACRFRTK